MVRCSRDVTSVRSVGLEVVVERRRILSSALCHTPTVLGRVNWDALVSPLFLDICSPRPEVATHGEVVYWELRKHRTTFPPTPFYLSSLRCHELF